MKNKAGSRRNRQVGGSFRLQCMCKTCERRGGRMETSVRRAQPAVGSWESLRQVDQRPRARVARSRAGGQPWAVLAPSMFRQG